MSWSTKNKSGFMKGQVTTFVKAVRKNTGDAWDWMVPMVQEALIAQKALSIMSGQASETVRTDAINDLYHEMLVEAGLRSE